MFASFKDISWRGWVRLASWTVFGTLGCLIISVLYNWLTFRHLGSEALRQGVLSATILPIVLAGPLFFYLSFKLRELAVANHRLSDLAAIDSLTGCLNRRAFTARVDEALKGGQGGALLVADADHFKAINDRFGHDRGDEALRLIVGAIRSSVRAGDAVGRLGGEEFGIYLPRASREAALNVAERIRAAVGAALFVPSGGQRYVLGVSVGCAVGNETQDFRCLFRLADESLYEAKHQGRNRVHCSESAVEAGDLRLAV